MKIEINNAYEPQGFEKDISIVISRADLCEITCNRESLIFLAQQMLEFAYFSKNDDEFHWIPRTQGCYNGQLNLGSCELYINLLRERKNDK
jgi:hypothetical protein